MRKGLAVGLAAGLLVMTTVVSANAGAFRNGRISFAQYDYSQGRRGGMHSIRPDGSDLRSILADGRSTHAAAYSPNGRRIAVDTFFDGIHHLQIIDLQGHVMRTVATFDRAIGFLTWSPHGSRLAFTVSGNRYSTVWTIRRDGSGLTELVRRAGSARWSPTGAWILVSMSRCDAQGCDETLGRVRPDGSDLRVVARDAFYGAWSPSGRRIVFYRFLGPDSASHGELFIARRDGSHERQITFTPKWSEGAPVWSPDGRWIAYSRWPTTGTPIGDLWKMNLRTGARVRLTSTGAFDEWVPIDWQRVPRG